MTYTNENVQEESRDVNDVIIGTGKGAAPVSALGVGGSTITDMQKDIQTNGTAITNHVEDMTNPHGVTAAQVGSYSKSETDNKFRTTLASGMTAQRPAAPLVGQDYWNTELKRKEVWDGTAWRNPAGDTYNIGFLAGGSSLDLQYTFPIPYPAGISLSVRPGAITQTVSYANTMLYPMITDVTNTGFHIQLNQSPGNQFGTGDLYMDFIVSVK